MGINKTPGVGEKNFDLKHTNKIYTTLLFQIYFMASYFLAILDRNVNGQLMVTVIMYMEENVSFRGQLRLNLIFNY